jgi:hypothetical protein
MRYIKIKSRCIIYLKKLLKGVKGYFLECFDPVRVIVNYNHI